jgi:polysaccharide biosynthesis protein PslH
MKLLLISPVPTDPLTAGNRARVLNIFRALEHLGHDVTFAYVPYEYGNVDYSAMRGRLQHRLRILETLRPPFPSGTAKLRRRLSRALRLSSAYLWDVDEWFYDGLVPQIMDLHEAENFETVLIEYVFLSKLACFFPKFVRTIIDTHDLFGNRHKHYLTNGLQPTWFATTEKEEINALNRANAVIAIQNEEAEYLRQQGAREVFCVGHVSTHEALPLPDPGGARLLFVGSANPINIQGLEWFVELVLPEIRAEIPGCELAIAGPAGHERSWPDGVLVLGELESLASAYSEATLVVNPVTFGTGLAVKTIEALSYGKALVATAAGARGLTSEFAGAVCVAQNYTFARKVIELLQNKAARAVLSQNAVATFNAWRLGELAVLDEAVRGTEYKRVDDL